MMVADVILKLLGRTPAAYSQPVTKWATITAILVDVAIPIVIVSLIIAPVFVMHVRGTLTIKKAAVALVLGCVLAYAVHWINMWSYGYGVGVIWHAINDPRSY